ncbi:MAG: alpha/beta fold hydrolase [Calditrichia bacterium]
MEYIYLHGFLSGPNSHKGNFFRERFREKGIEIHFPDLNGGDFEHTTLSKQQEIIERLIDSIDDQITVVGSSLGGYLAAVSAEKYKKIRRLVLMAPAFKFADRYLQKFTETQLQAWKEKDYMEVYHYHFQKTCRLHYGIVEDAKNFSHQTFGRQLPALIFHGIRDDSVPFQLSVEYLQDHPMTDLILFHSDHGLIDKLDLMWKYMGNFLGL